MFRISLVNVSKMRGMLQILTLMSPSTFTLMRTIKKLDRQDSILAAWKHCNTLIPWGFHSISPKIVSSILWIDDAYSIWQEIKHRFSQGDLIRIFQITFDMSSLRQGDSSITTYFTSSKKISDELFNFRSHPLLHLNL